MEHPRTARARCRLGLSKAQIVSPGSQDWAGLSGIAVVVVGRIVAVVVVLVVGIAVAAAAAVAAAVVVVERIAAAAVAGIVAAAVAVAVAAELVGRRDVSHRLETRSRLSPVLGGFPS